jgi:RNA 3'-terminal phosphate cyclase (ATP)
MRNTIKIDGSQGEGGGQILRTSLTLSMLLGRPLTIQNIRGKRSKPGLLRQHLACIEAAKQICNAKVKGAELHSDTLVFEPNAIKGGQYQFDIGSAGSTTLVFQTIYLPLLLADTPSSVQLTGGTHNPWAPSVSFLESSFLPLLRSMGADIRTQTDRWGYYPAGGGQWSAQITPSQLMPITLTERSTLISSTVTANVSHIRHSVAHRELLHYQSIDPVPDSVDLLETPNALSPGNYLSQSLEFDGFTVHFSELGEHRVKAESIAERLAKQTKHYIERDHVLCEYLTDQIMLPMLIAKGGHFTCESPSLHATTNLQLINTIADSQLQLKTLEGKSVLTLE